MLSSSPSSSSIVKAPAPPPPPASSSFSTASYRPCLTPSLSATARTWPLLPTLRAAASTLRSRSIALRLGFLRRCPRKFCSKHAFLHTYLNVASIG